MHTICVPLIVLSLLGLLWSLPVPAAFARLSPFANWATLAMVAALGWYFRLSMRLAAGMLAASVVLLVLVATLDRLPGPLWALSAGLFVAGWIGQFLGHVAEGKRPSFMRDLRFLLVGPLWLLAGVYQRLHIRT